MLNISNCRRLSDKTLLKLSQHCTSLLSLSISFCAIFSDAGYINKTTLIAQENYGTLEMYKIDAAGFG